MKRKSSWGTTRPTQRQLLDAMAIGGAMVRPPAFMSKAPRKSSGKKRSNPEAKIQMAIVAYLSRCCPEVMIASSFNGVHLSKGAMQMGYAKRQGLAVGDPDLRLSLPGGRTIFIEVKSEVGRLSDAQKTAHDKLTKLGFGVYVCRSIDDLREVINREGVPCREVQL